MKNQALRIYTDGAGPKPDGSGSGFAWVRDDTGERHIEKRIGSDSLTNNEAEYQAILSALKPLRAGTSAEIVTDSQLVVSQLRGDFRIRCPRLQSLATQIKTLIQRKRMSVKFTWVRRTENKAGKLL